MSTIAVIPARGGSKEIPRKNMRLMHGKPLVAYAIENAIASKHIDEIVVSSDSEEILAFASQYKTVVTLNRDPELAEDAITLDPVIFDAVVNAERTLGKSYDVVVTLQPTSPLLTANTLDNALVAFRESNLDTLISVVNTPHLSWKRENGRIVPGYEKRLNRQQLPPHYLETGAFFITRRKCITPQTRLGQSVSVYEIPIGEAIDVDSRQDWLVCEALLGQKTIVFRVDGCKELGLGHIFRALTLAYEFVEHDVVFICDEKHRLGIEKLLAANMRVVEIASDFELLSWLRANRPDIYVHDCLDTTTELMSKIRPLVGRLVTFEDLGDGARMADAVVNALYERSSPYSNEYCGKHYVALRDEFLVAYPKPFSEEVARVLVIFGGTDPLDLSSRIYAMAADFNSAGIRVAFDFVLGLGYSGNISESAPELGIEVNYGAIRMSDHMRRADMAFSSQGRTAFELASMGVPTIILAQNDREQLHSFAQMDNGFINLGLGSEVSDEDIRSTFEWLLEAKSVRREMQRLMLNNDLRSGIRRVKRIILGEEL